MKLKSKEFCACDLLESFEITQPTLSFHMRKLMECGLVVGKKDGIWMRYRINDAVVKQVIEQLEATLAPVDCLCEGKCAK